ncbi:MAG: heme-copper oxidase subunit III [Rehaibacterium terrae]|uniref:cytochrome c oxidase subunit 3 n=1 Tax=Rehaibacterium terrae TaxID=1341696 RepID=UPI00391C82C3
MTVSLLVLVLLMAALVTWLVRQSFAGLPWVAGAVAGPALPRRYTATRLGLGAFIAVATSIFSLTISAYVMRMAVSPEWELLPQPALAWINTGWLVLGSIALQLAWNAARAGKPARLRPALAAGAACTLAFFIGQYLLWRELASAGYALASHPAAAFFVLMSALHALHLAGGLWVLWRTLRRAWRGEPMARLRETVALCAVYWHYLLLVWGVLFTVLFVGAGPLYELCRV